MTKRKTRQSPASRGKPKIELTNANIRQAIEDLEINQPIHRVRLVGNRIELWLRGPMVVRWPETAAEKKKRLAAKPRRPAQSPVPGHRTGLHPGDGPASGKPKEPDPPGEPDEWPTGVPAGAYRRTASEE